MRSLHDSKILFVVYVILIIDIYEFRQRSGPRSTPPAETRGSGH